MDSSRPVFDEEPMNITKDTVTNLDYNDEDLISMLQDPRLPYGLDEELHCLLYHPTGGLFGRQQSFYEQMRSFDFEKFVRKTLDEKAKICQQNLDAEKATESEKFSPQETHNNVVDDIQPGPSTQNNNSLLHLETLDDKAKICQEDLEAEKAMESEKFSLQETHNNVVDDIQPDPSTQNNKSLHNMQSSGTGSTSSDQTTTSEDADDDQQPQKEINAEKFFQDSWNNFLHMSDKHSETGTSTQTSDGEDARLQKAIVEKFLADSWNNLQHMYDKDSTETVKGRQRKKREEVEEKEERKKSEVLKEKYWESTPT